MTVDTGSPAPRPPRTPDRQDLRTDLARVVFLSGDDDGEELFGTTETRPPPA